MSDFLVHALGWTLVHSLWQGGAAALVCLIGLRFIPRAAATARYAFAWAMLAAIVIAAVITFAALAPRTVNVKPMLSAGTAIESSSHVEAPQVVEASSVKLTIPFIPRIVTVWLCGVTLLSAWHLLGWIWIQRLKFSSRESLRWQPTAARLAERLNMNRAIRVIECARVDVPAVIGAFRPVILLPIAALSDLSVIQVEANLVHELAHIRRHDYLLNLLQTAAETLLFYHPAIWWISSQIRQERENCCDDIAVGIFGDPIGYAEALAALERSRLAPMHLALASNGGRLLDRVRRVLRLPPTRRTSKSSLAAALLALACGCAPLMATKPNEPPATSQSDVSAKHSIIIADGESVTITGGMIVMRPTTLPTTQSHEGYLKTSGAHGITITGTSAVIQLNNGEQAITADKPAPRNFIRVVVGKSDLTLDGKAIDMKSLRKKLEEIPQADRAATVLEVGANSDTTFGQFEEIFGQAAGLVKEFGLAYVSNVGLAHPAAQDTKVGSLMQREMQLQLEMQTLMEQGIGEKNPKYLKTRAEFDDIVSQIQKQKAAENTSPATTEPAAK